MVPENDGATANTTLGIGTLWPEVSVPRLHGKPPAHGAPAETNVRPGGAGSVTIALVALSGPAFVTVRA